jgi:hypothetical protein
MLFNPFKHTGVGEGGNKLWSLFNPKLALYYLIMYAFQGKSYWRGRLSTVDLLLLTSLAQLLFVLKILFTFFKKQGTLKRRSTILSLPTQLVFPGKKHKAVHLKYSFMIQSVKASAQIATLKGQWRHRGLFINTFCHTK